MFLLGGEMQGDERGAFGSVTEHQVQRFVFDLAILSADALSHKHGFLHLSSPEADLTAVVLQCSEQSLMAVDHFKFEQTAPYRGINPVQVDILVTDMAPGKELQKAIKGWDIDVCLAAKKNT